MTSPDDVRARFEAWASDGGKCPKVVEREGYDDSYRLMATHLYWLAWQAAHADLSGEVRELVEADREYDESRKGWPGEGYEADSYGVFGSEFDRCLCCDAESGPGILNEGVTHDADCKVAAIERAEKRRSAALAKFAHQEKDRD